MALIFWLAVICGLALLGGPIGLAAGLVLFFVMLLTGN